MSILRAKNKKPKLTRECLDSNGCLLFGKYRGQSAYDIVRKDSQYLTWLIDEVEDLDEQDREIISQLLNQYGKR